MRHRRQCRGHHKLVFILVSLVFAVSAAPSAQGWKRLRFGKKSRQPDPHVPHETGSVGSNDATHLPPPSGSRRRPLWHRLVSLTLVPPILAFSAVVGGKALAGEAAQGSAAKGTPSYQVASVDQTKEGPRRESEQKKGECYQVRGEKHCITPLGLWRLISGLASWYGPYIDHKGRQQTFHGRKTANGETYDMYAMTAAHKTLPFGTWLKVTHKGKSVYVRVNDRGPFLYGRVIDLSYAAAKALGLLGDGTGYVDATVVPKPEAKVLARRVIMIHEPDGTLRKLVGAL